VILIKEGVPKVTTAFDERVMKVGPYAGKPAEALMLVNVPDSSRTTIRRRVRQ